MRPSKKEEIRVKQFKVALFDLDGTLIDTEPQYTEFWRKAGQKYVPGMPDFAERIKGTTLVSMFENYFPDASVHQEIIDAIDAFEAQMQFPFVPGAVEYVRKLKAEGIKMAIVTSSNSNKLKSVWRSIPDFLNLFDKILTSEDFVASKPDPDCYLKGAAYFGAELADCVVFEDAITGLKAGQASGIYTVGLTTGNPPEVVSQYADMVISDFHQLL